MLSRCGATAAEIEAAARHLSLGGLVAFPTETVYGLGASATDDAAVAKIFAAKQRPVSHPLIAHVASQADVGHFATDVPEFARALMREFWPGPLTLILNRRVGVASASAGHHATIGLRCPDHPVALALLRAAAASGVRGISAPSANPFGRISPTSADHVMALFADSALVDPLLVIDGGPCNVGIESTIVDCTRGAPVMLRPGVLGAEALSIACGQSVLTLDEAHAIQGVAPKSSGSLAQHYQPKARLRLMSATSIQAGLDLLGSDAKHMAVYARSPIKLLSSAVILRRMPDDAASCAQALFASLHAFDAAGVKLIWVEELPSQSDWDGVRDRLDRAAA